jgi:hypothetical protein
VYVRPKRRQARPRQPAELVDALEAVGHVEARIFRLGEEQRRSEQIELWLGASRDMREEPQARVGPHGRHEG